MGLSLGYYPWVNVLATEMQVGRSRKVLSDFIRRQAVTPIARRQRIMVAVGPLVLKHGPSASTGRRRRAPPDGRINTSCLVPGC